MPACFAVFTSHLHASAACAPHHVSILIAGGEWQAASTTLTLHWALQGHLLGKSVLLPLSIPEWGTSQKRNWSFQVRMKPWTSMWLKDPELSNNQ